MLMPTFLQFLQEFRQASSLPNRRVVVVTDNAGYHKANAHRGWREAHAAEFALDFLPPYSPELNPIERVWKLSRRLCLHNCYFDALDDVIKTVEEQFNVGTPTKPSADYAHLLKTLCSGSGCPRNLSARQPVGQLLPSSNGSPEIHRCMISSWSPPATRSSGPAVDDAQIAEHRSPPARECEPGLARASTNKAAFAG